MNPIKVLHLSVTDAGGGAAKEAYRLHRGLVESGIDSSMVVGAKASRDPTVQAFARTRADKLKMALWPYLDLLSLHRYRQRKPVPFSPGKMGYADRMFTSPQARAVDVITLYWVAGGFLRPESLRLANKPLVWRLSDMWSFTGGCHYSANCAGYEQHCGRCPLLASDDPRDISHRVLERKRAAWSSLDITIVSPSRWLAQCAGRSALFSKYRIEVIPSAVDLRVFKPIDRGLARSILNLPQDKKLVLFSAANPSDDRRKGYPELREALRLLARQAEAKNIHAVVVGGLAPASGSDLPLPASYLGFLSDDITLNLAYAAADVIVVPSLEDNFPNVMLEALAAGTPVVAFGAGGMPEIVQHQVNGYLASVGDVAGLAEGIRWTLFGDVELRRLQMQAHASAVEKFSMDLQVQRYIELYEDITGRSPGVAKSAPAVAEKNYSRKTKQP